MSSAQGAPQPAPIPGPAPSPGPGPAAPPKKKSMKGCIAAGCGGCMFLSLLVCGTGGYLFYLEEGVSYTDPGELVTEIPYVPGQPFSIPVDWSGTGYAFHRLYIDLGPAAPTETRVTGTALCVRAPEMSNYGGGYGYVPGAVDETYYYPVDSDHAGWVRVADEYVRTGAEPVQCGGQLEVSPPVPAARLIVTRRQRPSDWLAGL